jgi:hypothetical protein
MLSRVWDAVKKACGEIEKGCQLRSRPLAVLTYFTYAPFDKSSAALLDKPF